MESRRSDLTGRFWPTAYDNILEVDRLVQAEDTLFRDLILGIDQMWDNQFVVTCDVATIRKYEDMLSIVPSPSTETLEFRRQRIINRLTLLPPFTMRFFRDRLDRIIGPGLWTIQMAYGQRTLTIVAPGDNTAWTHEIAVTILQFLPANLVVINAPLLIEGVEVDNFLQTDRQENFYLLGLWTLGVHPFATITEGTQHHMPSSVLTPTLNLSASQLSAFIAGNITATINGVETIPTDKIQTSAAGNHVSIRFSILASLGLDTITSIALSLTDGTPLINQAGLSIDAHFDTLVAQEIRYTVKEN